MKLKRTTIKNCCQFVQKRTFRGKPPSNLKEKHIISATGSFFDGLQFNWKWFCLDNMWAKESTLKRKHKLQKKKFTAFAFNGEVQVATAGGMKTVKFLFKKTKKWRGGCKLSVTPVHTWIKAETWRRRLKWIKKKTFFFYWQLFLCATTTPCYRCILYNWSTKDLGRRRNCYYAAASVCRPTYLWT